MQGSARHQRFACPGTCEAAELTRQRLGVALPARLCTQPVLVLGGGLASLRAAKMRACQITRRPRKHRFKDSGARTFSWRLAALARSMSRWLPAEQGQKAAKRLVS